MGDNAAQPCALMSASVPPDGSSKKIEDSMDLNVPAFRLVQQATGDPTLGPTKKRSLASIAGGRKGGVARAWTAQEANAARWND
jgi:hypothetical protein